MDVVMLGGSDAGKTTYVSLMYRWLNDGVGGFSCGTADPRVHAALRTAGDNVLSGIYPRNTQQREVHDLILRYQGSDVLPFRWRDYRGGVVTQPGATSAAARELHRDLNAADGILLFADAWRLLHGRGQDFELHHMITSVLRALAERDKRPTPLVIVLTKFDLIEQEGPAVIHRLREPFGHLIRSASAEPHIKGAVVPLVCGRRPVNAGVPALWVLHSGLVGLAHRLQESADTALARGRQAADKDTVWDRVLSRIFFEPSWRAISERAFADHEAERTRLLPLLASAARLNPLLRSVDSF
ncbi:GTPase domain-containing protein [Streptomyces sp. JJ38]|uniref:TRAFAC clade GTPase domain-containing protein n=1 Tax=Streptomyces sp. JJ38 TaxID=2738128 RepID=UPI001C57D1AC|nr:GTPase domain-containing protein [Streptomyces sp. JJ38]MBW1597398.1 GTPase domain-containing protein [Streptomyces sp. JJ38]